MIGSMLFNTLGVAACASLFTKKPIQIDWWPITRDSILFSFNISVLVAMAWDGVIMWWETIILVTLYVGYWCLMFQNPRIMKFVKNIVEDRLMWCQRIKNYDIINQKPFDAKPTEAAVPQIIETANSSARQSYLSVDNHSVLERTNTFNIYSIDPPRKIHDRRKSFDLSRIDEVDEEEFKVWEIPHGSSKWDMVWYFVTWPIRFCLHYTIPNPITHKKWFAFSFVMCIVWIAVVAYVIFWMVVVIGDTFGIPEPIMGFTLLAFGGCMPEAISAVIVARKGSGQMGVSNALGANNLAILFSLGLPWFIRTMASGAGFTDAHINIYSYGIEFTIMGLLLAVGSLYVTIAAVGYKLRKTVGGFLGSFYLILATFAILVELDFFLEPTERCI